MIEAAMLIALGFLFALLIGFMIIPAISRRADRLARRRAEAAFPLSLAEIEAERDHLRASFAIRQQDLEKQADDGFKARACAMEDIGRRDMTISSLQETLQVRDQRIAVLEQELATTQHDLASTRFTLSATEGSLVDTQGILEARLQDIAALEDTLSQMRKSLQDTHSTLSAREQSLAEHVSEVASLHKQTKGQSEDISSLVVQRDRINSDLTETRAALSEAMTRISIMADKHAETHEELRKTQEVLAVREQEFLQLSERSKALGAQAHDLEHRLATVDDSAARARTELNTRVDELVAARREITVGKKSVQELTRSLKSAEARLGKQDGMSRQEAEALSAELAKAETQASKLQADKKALSADLSLVKAERARLKQDLSVARRQSERLEATIRMENAALRSEIAKVADRILDHDTSQAPLARSPVLPG